MNIFDAARLVTLAQTPPDNGRLILKRSKSDIQAKMGEDSRDMLTSKTFYLVKVPLNRIASPIKASSKGPIIVDINSEKIGQIKSGFFPKVIVISGQATFKEAYSKGEVSVPIWIGSIAAAGLDIKADHMMGADELRQKLQDELQKREGPQTNTRSNMIFEANPWIVEVYPFEGYFIYRKDAKLWKQGFTVNEAKRDIALDGVAREVIQQYVDKLRPAQRMEAAAMLHACGCQPTVQAQEVDSMCTGKEDCECPACTAKREKMKARKAKK